MADKRNHPVNAGTHYPFIYMIVWAANQYSIVSPI